MIKVLFALFLSGVALAAPEKKPGFDWTEAKLIAIQDRGRTKPLETFAQESVLYMTGKRSYKKLPAIQVIFGWMIAFEEDWEQEPFIRVDYAPLKTAIGLDTNRNFFTPEEIRTNLAFQKLVSEIRVKQRDEESLSELDKKALDLQGKRGLIEAVVTGQALTIFPNSESKDAKWFSLADLAEPRNPIPRDKIEKVSRSIKQMLSGYIDGNAAEWNQSVAELSSTIRSEMAGEHYPSRASLLTESRYNSVHPFRWAWIFYLMGAIFLTLKLVSNSRWAQILGLAGVGAGFLTHIYGFYLRMAISGRPPVTNMYESVIWVSWGCVLFAGLVWLRYRNDTILLASSIFSVVGLVLADNLPSVLDGSIQPLEPVLRSNFWLTIHVLTITLSYAAFAVGLCLGNVVIGNYLFRPNRTEMIQEYTLYMYRAVQIGVLLLAAGTILGGVWADYSWGRFWGWDPKEVWALVALLLYLAVLHGRFTGWLRGFGFAAATVIAFLGVLMAWYGVNFVLGVGLHSYGFGTGGMLYVTLYVLAQLAFIAVAYVRFKKSSGGNKPDNRIFPKGTV